MLRKLLSCFKHSTLLEYNQRDSTMQFDEAARAAAYKHPCVPGGPICTYIDHAGNEITEWYHPTNPLLSVYIYSIKRPEEKRPWSEIVDDLLQ